MTKWLARKFHEAFGCERRKHGIFVSILEARTRMYSSTIRPRPSRINFALQARTFRTSTTLASKFRAICGLAGIIALLVVFSGISLISAQEEEKKDLEVHLYNVEPEETTKKYHNRTETEYRIQQNLYMIKTVPDAGSPYYMVDKRGTGELEYRRNMENLDMQVPEWVLLRW